MRYRPTKVFKTQNKTGQVMRRENYLTTRSITSHHIEKSVQARWDRSVKCHSSAVKTLQLAVIRAMWVRLFSIWIGSNELLYISKAAIGRCLGWTERAFQIGQLFIHHSKWWWQLRPLISGKWWVPGCGPFTLSNYWYLLPITFETWREMGARRIQHTSPDNHSSKMVPPMLKEAKPHLMIICGITATIK